MPLTVLSTMPRTPAATAVSSLVGSLGALVQLPSSSSPFRKCDSLSILDLLPETRYLCDECQREVPSDLPRYKCSRCRDYDTCAACHATSKHAHDDGERQPLWSEVRQWPEPATAPLGDDASFAATIDDAMLRFGDRPCVGQRSRVDEPSSAVWLTYRAMRERVQACSVGLSRRIETVRQSRAMFMPTVRFCNCTAEPRPCVAIWAANSIDWLVADLACHLQHIVIVPIDYSTVDAQAAGIMQQMEASVVFVDPSLLPRFASLASGLPAVHTVVVLDSSDLVLSSSIPGHPHLAVTSIEELERAGAASAAQLPVAVCEARPDCVISVMYTSGSTGQAGSVAKGVLMTDAAYSFRAGQSKRGQDVRLAIYLPLSNSTSRSQAVRCMGVGGAFGIVRAPSHLVVDFAWIQPTTLSCPPRMWSMLHSTYTADLTYALTHTPSPNTPNSTSDEAESRAMGRFRARLGGRVVHASVGGAKSSKDLLRFLERCFGAGKAHDSYGATECGSIARDGVLLPGVKAMLLDVPALGFTSSDQPWPRGELCVSTPNMAAGYTSATASSAFFQSNGQLYYRTGDVVELRRAGKRGEGDTVRVLDRVSHVVKLSNGLFVSPEAIESAFELYCPAIEHMLLHAPVGGDGMLAVIVPRPSAARWSEAEWLEHLDIAIQEHKLPSYCKPTRVHVDRSGEAWEGLGLLAVQDKKRRGPLLARYRDELERLANQSTASEVGVEAMDVDQQSTSEPLALRPRLQAALLSHLPTNTSQFDAYASKSWSDAGGDSMAAIAAAHSLQLIVPDRPVTATHILSATSLRAILLHLGADNGNAAHPAVEPAHIDWSSECSLPADIRQSRRPVPLSSAPKSSATQVVLLTGATGFLGSFILAELLAAHSGCTVVCIVRAASQEAGLSRLTHSLIQYGLASSDSDARSMLSSRRVRVEAGDAAADRFGLPIDRYNELINSVTHVIHNASRVNFILPYSALRRDNVHSTLQAIRFCATTRPPTPLCYVSTASTEHCTLASLATGGHGGYAQSKYVSERLVMAAAGKLGVPACVVRPTSIIGDSKTGAGPVDASRDLVSALWLGVARVGRIHLLSKQPVPVTADRPLTLLDVLPLLISSAPDGTSDGVNDHLFRVVGLPPAFRLVPVDHVARVVVQLTRSLLSAFLPGQSAEVVTVSDPRGPTSSLSLLLASDRPLDTAVVFGEEAVQAWRRLVLSDALPPVMRAFRNHLLQPATQWSASAASARSPPAPRTIPTSYQQYGGMDTGCPVVDLPLLHRCFQRLSSTAKEDALCDRSGYHKPFDTKRSVQTTAVSSHF